MSAGIYNFTVEQGATKVLRLVYKDSTGAVVPLTAYNNARMQIRDKVGGKVFADLTTANNGIVIDAANGMVTVRISHTLTTKMTFEAGIYDLFLYPIDENTHEVFKFLKGEVGLDESATR